MQYFYNNDHAVELAATRGEWIDKILGEQDGTDNGRLKEDSVHRDATQTLNDIIG